MFSFYLYWANYESVTYVLNYFQRGKLKQTSLIIVSPDESRGYLGFSTVMPLPQRFPFNNLKNILIRPFKFGMWVYIWAMPRTLLFCDIDLQFQGHWWPLKGQILAIFSHSGPVLIYRKFNHPMAGIYNTYICPL